MSVYTDYASTRLPAKQAAYEARQGACDEDRSTECNRQRAVGRLRRAKHEGHRAAPTSLRWSAAGDMEASVLNDGIPGDRREGREFWRTPQWVFELRSRLSDVRYRRTRKPQGTHCGRCDRRGKGRPVRR